MNKRILFRIFLITSVLFFSCSKEEDCPVQNVDDINAIYLDFVIGGDNGFTEEMLDSLFIVRFQVDTLDTLTFQADTFLFYQDGFYADDYKIRLSKNIPAFGPIGAPYYTAYNYSIQSRDEDFEILLTGIELEGSYDNDNCIYTNHTKKIVVNGDTVDVSGTQDYILLGN